MQEFIGFAQENWTLLLLWVSAAATLYYTETKKAGKSVNTTEATRLMNRDKALIVDIREVKDFAIGHISGAKNYPASSFELKASELDKFKARPVIVVCKMGTAAGSITKILKRRGFGNVVRLAGGMAEWQAASLPMKKGKKV